MEIPAIPYPKRAQEAAWGDWVPPNTQEGGQGPGLEGKDWKKLRMPSPGSLGPALPSGETIPLHQSPAMLQPRPFPSPSEPITSYWRSLMVSGAISTLLILSPCTSSDAETPKPPCYLFTNLLLLLNGLVKKTAKILGRTCQRCSCSSPWAGSCRPTAMRAT